MKKLFTILVMLAAMNASGQWVLNFSDTTTHFTDIKFTSASNGFAVGSKYFLSGQTEGKVYKTTNSGANWSLQSVGSIPGIFGLCFVDQNTGWFVGDKGLVRKTIDGGLNWTQQTLDSSQYSERVYFVNSTTGWISGNYSYKTTNGGVNWIKITSAPSSTFAINFINESTGFLTVYYSKIYRTSNAGVTWNLMYEGQYHTYIYDITFLNDNTGWAVGDDPLDGVLKTTNGGLNWNKIYEVIDMRSIYFKDAITGWIGGNWPYINKTTNGGLNWTLQSLPADLGNYYINRIVRTNDSSLFAVGSGYIFKTTNGGVGIKNIGTEIPSSYILSQNYPNPFNPITNVKFSIVNTGDVKLVVYDVMGREVQTLVNEKLKAGTYEASFDGSALNSGVYFYKLTTEGFSETKRMMLVK